MLNPPDSSPPIITLFLRIASPTCLNPTAVSITFIPSFAATLSIRRLEPTVLTTLPSIPRSLRCLRRIAIISFGETYSPFSFITPNLSASPSLASPIAFGIFLTVSINSFKNLGFGSGIPPPNSLS